MPVHLGPRARPVYECLRTRFLAGEFRPGVRLPSQQSMARTYGLALMTMRDVLQHLQEDGFIQLVPGSGTYARNPEAEQVTPVIEHAARGQEPEFLAAIIAVQTEIAGLELDLHLRMRRVVERTRAITGADGAVIELIEALRITERVMSGMELDNVSPLIAPTSFTGQMLHADRVFACPDVTADATVDRTRLHPDIRSLVVGPLHHRGRVVGLVSVHGREPGAFSRRDQYALQLIDGIVGTALAGAAEFESQQQTLAQKTAALQDERRSVQWIRNLIQRMDVGIILLDVTGRVVLANSASGMLLGLTPDQMEGRTPLAPDWQILDESGRPIDNLRERILRVSQGHPLRQAVIGIRAHDTVEPVWVLGSLEPLIEEDGQVHHLLCTLLDITRRKQTEDESNHRALHDPLTDLPNRALFQDRLEQVVLGSDCEQAALLYLDLDGFKRVNDAYGHDVGDRALLEIASRLQTCVRESDTVARQGGDEFAILLPGAGYEVARTAAERILGAINEPLEPGSGGTVVGGSLGVALYPSHGAEARTLMRHADTAMYAAKASRAGYVLYSPSIPAPVTGHDPGIDLIRALDRGEMVLHYQPRLHLTSMRPTGADVRVLWSHREKGLTQPMHVFAGEHDPGLARTFTIWLVRRVLTDLSTDSDPWPGRTGIPVPVSVLADRALPGLLRAEADSAGVALSSLSLLVHEPDLTVPLDSVADGMVALASLGVNVSLDSSGNRLDVFTRLNLTSVRIEAARLFGHIGGERQALVSASVAALAYSLGLSVVITGLDTMESLGRAREEGHLLGQGAALAGYLDAQAYRAWLKRATSLYGC